MEKVRSLLARWLPALPGCIALVGAACLVAADAEAACTAGADSKRLQIPAREADKIRIATFNVRILSNASRDDCELAYIAGILRHFDLVALQELRDGDVLDRLRKALDQDKVVKVPKDTWQAEVSKPVGRGVKELYAFLYRQDRLEVVAEGRLVADKKDQFIREPYFASFRAGDDEFTLLTIHLLFGTAKGRELELAALADEFGKLRKRQPAGRRLILLGDFNEPPENKRFAEALKTVSRLNCRIVEGPGVKTTIGDVSLYDNVCYLDAGNAAKDPVRIHAIEKFDFTVFRVDACLAGITAAPDTKEHTAARKKCLAKASLPVSDHRPVWFDLPFRPAEE
ncbi:endonuclease/exonuclease/phosphatase family protein [Desertibaculum subflavum]|uniref:endonuclease/exonuclease/phosphatase family protein n=1 Tax=Desertibaculum subflavum TaxID=2268458 RepID=UPI000E666BEA